MPNTLFHWLFFFFTVIIYWQAKAVFWIVQTDGLCFSNSFWLINFVHHTIMVLPAHPPSHPPSHTHTHTGTLRFSCLELSASPLGTNLFDEAQFSISTILRSSLCVRLHIELLFLETSYGETCFGLCLGNIYDSSNHTWKLLMSPWNRFWKSNDLKSLVNFSPI